MTVEVFDSIARIDRAEWDALFPGEIETWDYYRAVEQAGLPGFVWRYFALRQDGVLAAAAPAFLTDYRIDTTLTGPLKRWSERLARLAPRLLSIRMLCVGSPVSEICHVGVTPNILPERRQALLTQLLQGLREEARRDRVGLIAIKDAPDGSPIAEACAAAGHTRLPGMPTAVLPLDFADMDGYLKNLSRVTRKDMKRKMRQGQELRVEARGQIDDVIEPVMALYEATWQRSELRLEHLTPEYFKAVLRNMPGRATCFLYWEGDTLAAFNLVLHDEQRMIDKFFGTNSTARRLNLYHFSWMENVRQCLARGLRVFQAGQAFYGEKVRMGSRLEINWQFFTHRSAIVNFLLRAMSRLVRLDRMDPEIRNLMARVK
jgi:predicted N-acyltransferase